VTIEIRLHVHKVMMTIVKSENYIYHQNAFLGSRSNNRLAAAALQADRRVHMSCTVQTFAQQPVGIYGTAQH